MIVTQANSGDEIKENPFMLKMPYSYISYGRMSIYTVS